MLIFCYSLLNSQWVKFTLKHIKNDKTQQTKCYSKIILKLFDLTNSEWLTKK